MTQTADLDTNFAAGDADILQVTVDFLTNPERAAQIAGLRYVTDAEPGYRRKPWGRGFTYLDPEGNHVQDDALRQRFASLAIPPAWTDVWICVDDNGHLLVTGRDDAERKQYIYHPKWQEVRSRTKFNRLIPFAQALPEIRARVDADLRRHGLPREKVLALVVRLLEEARIRIGNPEYARKYNTRGLTTLNDEHVTISGSTLDFEFVGKSGQERRVSVRDRRLARHLKRCQELPGQELFQYVDDEGRQRTIESGDVNNYLRTLTQQSFTAKDFRTWAGTVLALDELFEHGPAATEKDARHQIVDAIKAVAEQLGNTPAVCRDYYIHPAVLDAYRDGSLFEQVSEAAAEADGDVHSLSPDERAVLKILYRQVTLPHATTQESS